MNQKAHETVRKTIEISNSLSETIQSMADSKKWSFSQMGADLLEFAVKEKNRKKKIPSVSLQNSDGSWK